MLSLDVLTLFFTASVVLCLAPGPDNLFVLTQSGLHGPRAGLVVTLGLCTGLLAHTSAVAFGVAAIFRTSELAFRSLTLVGAAYLLYLAWQAFRAKPSQLANSGNGAIGFGRLYGRGVIMNMTNPKVAIFFLAFLPQFADPSNGAIALQMIQLGVVFIMATILVFGAVAWGAGLIGTWLNRSARAQTIMNRVAGTIFLGLALRLALAER